MRLLQHLLNASDIVPSLVSAVGQKHGKSTYFQLITSKSKLAI